MFGTIIRIGIICGRLTNTIGWYYHCPLLCLCLLASHCAIVLLCVIAARRSIHQYESSHGSSVAVTGGHTGTTGTVTGTGVWTLAGEMKQWLGFDVPPLARRLTYTLALVLADVTIFQIIVRVITSRTCLLARSALHHCLIAWPLTDVV